MVSVHGSVVTLCIKKPYKLIDIPCKDEHTARILAGDLKSFLRGIADAFLIDADVGDIMSRVEAIGREVFSHSMYDDPFDYYTDVGYDIERIVESISRLLDPVRDVMDELGYE